VTSTSVPLQATRPRPAPDAKPRLGTKYFLRATFLAWPFAGRISINGVEDASAPTASLIPLRPRPYDPGLAGDAARARLYQGVERAKGAGGRPDRERLFRQLGIYAAYAPEGRKRPRRKAPVALRPGPRIGPTSTPNFGFRAIARSTTTLARTRVLKQTRGMGRSGVKDYTVQTSSRKKTIPPPTATAPQALKRGNRHHMISPEAIQMIIPMHARLTSNPHSLFPRVG